MNYYYIINIKIRFHMRKNITFFQIMTHENIFGT